MAVNVQLGYNQEDSLVMNQASLECGVFRSESYKAEVDNKDIQVKRQPSDDMLNFGKIQSKLAVLTA